MQSTSMMEQKATLSTACRTQCTVHGVPLARGRSVQLPHRRAKSQRPRRHVRCRVASLPLPETVRETAVTRDVRPISPPPAALDARGTVVNDASISKVPEAFLPLLNSISGAYQRACGSALLGVYVRGSLPKGTFLPGVSDVDTFALVLVEDEAQPQLNSSQHARYKPVNGEQLSGLRHEIQTLLVTTEQHFRRLDYTKLEIRLLPLPISHPAAQQLLAATAELPLSSPLPDSVGLTPSMVREMPACFTLATQSITLWGWELPRQLPAAAGVPNRLELLPSLVDDIAMALDAAAEAEAVGDMAKQVSAVRWCLKRLIRAGLELTSDKQCTYTRDLYWAVQLAAPHLPKLAPGLQRALKLYVELQPDDPATQRLAASAAAGGKRKAGASSAQPSKSPTASSSSSAGGGLVNGHAVNGVSVIALGSNSNGSSAADAAADSPSSSGRHTPALGTPSTLFLGPAGRPTVTSAAAAATAAQQQARPAAAGGGGQHKRNWWSQLLGMGAGEAEDVEEVHSSSSSSSSQVGSGTSHHAAGSSLGAHSWANMLQRLVPGLGLVTGLGDNPSHIPTSNGTGSTSSSSQLLSHAQEAHAAPESHHVPEAQPAPGAHHAVESPRAASSTTPEELLQPPQQESWAQKWLQLKDSSSDQHHQQGSSSAGSNGGGAALLFVNGAVTSFLGGGNSKAAKQQQQQQEAMAAQQQAAAAAALAASGRALVLDELDEMTPWQAKQRAEAANPSSSGPMFLTPRTAEDMTAAVQELEEATSSTSISRQRVKPGGTPISAEELQVLDEEEKVRVAAAAGAARELVPRVLLQEAAALASTLTRQIDTQFLQQMLEAEPGWVTHHVADKAPAKPLWAHLVPVTPEAAEGFQQLEQEELQQRRQQQQKAKEEREAAAAEATAALQQERKNSIFPALLPHLRQPQQQAGLSASLGVVTTPQRPVAMRNPVALALEQMLHEHEHQEQQEMEAEEAQLALLLEQAEQLMVAAEERAQQAEQLGPDAQLSAQYLVQEAEHLLQEAESAAAAYAAGEALDADLGRQLLERAAAAAEYAASSSFVDASTSLTAQYYDAEQYGDGAWTEQQYAEEGWDYTQDGWVWTDQGWVYAGEEQQQHYAEGEWSEADAAAWEQYYSQQGEWSEEAQAAWAEQQHHSGEQYDATQVECQQYEDPAAAAELSTLDHQQHQEGSGDAHAVELEPAATGAAAQRPHRVLQLTEQQQLVMARLQKSVAWASQLVARQRQLLPWHPLQADVGADHGEVLDLVGGTPPPVRVPVVTQARQYDWYNDTDRTAAATAIWRCLQSAGHGSSSSLTPHPEALGGFAAALSPSTCGAVAAAACGPVLLKGVAAGWRACDAWKLGFLQQTGFTGKVRVAPSLQFPMCEPQLAQILVQLKGATAAPSTEVVMSVSEFVARLRRGNRLQPIVYQPNEYYYMQADVPSHLQPDLELEQLLDQLTTAGQTLAFDSQGDSYARGLDVLGGGGDTVIDWSYGPAMAARMRTQPPSIALTQQPRMWVSPAGAVSPTHYDSSDSFLVQLRGRKRMLFWSPDQLAALYPYPDTHLLRRRARFNVTQPQWEKFPLASAEALGALEVILEPGDAVFFPPMWSHYTESLTPSVSVTVRLKMDQQQ